jgi:hypothetical protein
MLPVKIGIDSKIILNFNIYRMDIVFDKKHSSTHLYIKYKKIKKLTIFVYFCAVNIVCVPKKLFC